MAVVSLLTYQTHTNFLGLFPVPYSSIQAQLTPLLTTYNFHCIKIGAVDSFTTLLKVYSQIALSDFKGPIVIDPVLHPSASNQKAFLGEDKSKLQSLKKEEHEIIFTPNIKEAGAIFQADSWHPLLLDHTALSGTTWVVTGEVKNGSDLVNKVYSDGKVTASISVPYFQNFSMHGSGCAFASAFSGYLARGESLSNALTFATQYTTNLVVEKRYAISS
jgi:hydroxymethylpyrimidine/phosphomethylpyrimidine kinase